MTRHEPFTSYVIALGFGFAVAAWLLPPGLLTAWPPAGLAVGGDPAAHVIGQRYFIAAPWQWPILATPDLGLPEGTTVGFTDSIPIAALLTKLARPVLPAGFQSVSLWLGVCYIAQTPSAVFALRSAGERRLLPALCVAILGTFMPVLLARYVHESLSSHFLLLWSIGLYFRLASNPAGPVVGAPFAVLLLCLLVHPYLLVMAAAMLAAAPLTLLLRGDGRCVRAGAGIGASILAAAASAWVLGYGGAADPAGFGHYQMNVLSPFLPVGSSLFPFFGGIAQGSAWEGYSYLGAGVCVILAVALGVGIKRGTLPGQARNHAGLLVVTAAMACFALSNRIYFGSHLLADLGQVPDWLQQVRVTGRFFWPLSYVLVVVAVAEISKGPLRTGSVAPLVLAAVLQILDTTGLREQLRHGVADLKPWAIQQSVLRPLFAANRRLVILPRIGCGADFDHDPQLAEVALLASEYTMPVNTVYAARTQHPPRCEDDATAGLASGEVRLFLPGWVAAANLVPDASRDCRQAGDLAVCARNSGAGQGLARLTTDTPITYGWGWCADQPGAKGRWSCGDSVSMFITGDTALDGSQLLVIHGRVLAPLGSDTQDVAILVNGVPQGAWSFKEGEEVALRIPLRIDGSPPRPLQVRFDIGAPVRPVDRGINSDARRLGFWLTSLAVVSAPR